MSYFKRMLALGLIGVAYANVIEYQLNIDEQTIAITDKDVVGLAINQTIPGPTLRATVGDTLRVEVINHLDTETSIHWHGVLVPNNMDGVPYINGPPIKAHDTFIYEFPITHSGTYWYHSHSGLQEQQGLYGALVFSPKNEVKEYDEEHVLVLSDWTNTHPNQVLANLKKDSEYYALQKKSVQSWLEVLQYGSEAIRIRIQSALKQMGPMDLSDIGYDAFLINGKISSLLSQAKPGTRVKLRIINAAASSYFVLEYSGGPMTLIESDGMKVEPFTAQKIRIALAETYDVIVTIPSEGTYEFRGSAEDGTGYAVAHMGQGPLKSVAPYLKPNLVGMNMMGGMDHKQTNEKDRPSAMSKQSNQMNMMQNHEMHHEKQEVNSEEGVPEEGMPAFPQERPVETQGSEQSDAVERHHMHGRSSAMMPMHSASSQVDSAQLPHVDYFNNYQSLKSPVVTTLPQDNPVRVVTLKLTGSMERYVWSINDTPMYAADDIEIQYGENVRFILVNETMMHHPIHLHGHFFRVLNGQGEYSPLKHTVNVSPLETVEIEFEANEEKSWIFHCHNLYHMKLGMGGVIHYADTEPTDHTPTDRTSHRSLKHNNTWFQATTIEGFSNLSHVTAKLMQHNDNVIATLRHNYNKDYEGELIYQRYVSLFLGLYGGGAFNKDALEDWQRGVVGATYTLPLLIKADLRLYTNGHLRLECSNEHQLTDRVSLDWVWNTDKEYTLGLNYVLTPQLNLASHYDSRERWGVGFHLKF